MIARLGHHLTGSSEPDDAELFPVQFFRFSFSLVAPKAFEKVDEFGKDKSRGLRRHSCVCHER
jgi:hypothetical protein